MGKESNQDAADKQREKADLWKKMTDENAARAEREWKREEEAANRAARELQEKKKKKRRKIRVAVLLIFVIAAAGTFGGLRYQQYQKEKASQEADVLALADGEELVYGKITKAVGNDITVTILDVKTDTAAEEGNDAKGDSDVSNVDQQPSEETSDSQSADTVEKSAENQGRDAQASAAENTGGQSSAPEGNDQGSALDGTSQDARMQNAVDNQSTADTQNTVDAQTGPAQNGSPQNALQYTETSQTKEYEVPVGTAVTTRLGATTSFSRLSTGNIIGVVVQSGTDNILRIKIVE